MCESNSYEDEKSPAGWWCRLVCFAADIIVGMIVLCVFRFVLLPYIFSIEIHQAYSFFKDNPVVIQWVVWPITGLVVLLLLRDVIMRILYQVPSFIYRSRYGASIEREVPKQKIAEQEDCVPAQTSSNGAVNNQLSVSLPKMTSADAERLSAIAIAKIAKDFGLSSFGAARIRGTNYVFDEILQNGQDLYGVEVKCGYNCKTIENTVHELEMLRFALPTDMRKHFTIILCVISQQTDRGWQDALMSRMKGVDMVVRMYTREELERF